ncbi:MAG: M24 family metallopeptidase [Planctomycetota bacterium]|jgi:methionyl aminopeptidase
MVVTASRDIDAAYAAAQCVRRTHEAVAEKLREGQTLSEIDGLVAAILESLDCTSAFLRYRIQGHPPFPSHSCLSVNECIVHGTHNMTREPIRAGDLLSIDIGVRHHGWIGDAAWTYGVVAVNDEAQRLMTCGRETLRRGIASMQPGRPLIDWPRVVQPYVEEACGFHLVRGLGGHGYGRKLHGPPFLSNVLPTTQLEWPDAWKIFEPGLADLHGGRFPERALRGGRAHHRGRAARPHRGHGRTAGHRRLSGPTRPPQRPAAPRV